MKIFLFAHNYKGTRFTAVTSLAQLVQLNSDRRLNDVFRNEGMFKACVARLHPSIENYDVINLIPMGADALELTGPDLQKIADDLADSKQPLRVA